MQDLLLEARSNRRDLDRLQGHARSVGVQGQQVTAEVEHLRGQVALFEKTAILLSQLGEQRQESAQRQIEQLVTRGLQTIFGEELSFHVVQTVRAKASNVDFIVRSTLEDGSVVDTPVMDARGGGLAATVGFLLRLVVLLLSGRKDTTLVLDETFAHVSDEYVGRLAEFLREVVDKTSIQVVMVTHQAAFTEPADVVYRFSLKDGTTRVHKET